MTAAIINSLFFTTGFVFGAYNPLKAPKVSVAAPRTPCVGVLADHTLLYASDAHANDLHASPGWEAIIISPRYPKRLLLPILALLVSRS